MYHDICTEGDPYSVSESNFRHQMKFLYDNNFHTITLEDLYQNQKENILLPSKVIIITFDDGFANNYTKAFPILKQYDFRATFFITTNFIKLQTGLSRQQICDLNNSNMCIGSHTKTHRFLSNLSKDEIQSELADSKKILEDIIDAKVEHLSLPGGRSNNKVVNIAKQVGYKTICKSHIGCNSSNSNLFHLSRIPVRKNMVSKTEAGSNSPNSFEKIVFCNHDQIRKLQKASWLKVLGKLILGNKLYHSLWNLFHKGGK